jgi:hypothetical protein
MSARRLLVHRAERVARRFDRAEPVGCGGPWLGSYEEIIADYESETGVRVNLTSFPFDGLMTQQANAAQIGSNAFDLFLLNEQWVGLFYDNQWVQPLTDVEPSFSWDPVEHRVDLRETSSLRRRPQFVWSATSAAQRKPMLPVELSGVLRVRAATR